MALERAANDAPARAPSDHLGTQAGFHRERTFRYNHGAEIILGSPAELAGMPNAKFVVGVIAGRHRESVITRREGPTELTLTLGGSVVNAPESILDIWCVIGASFIRTRMTGFKMTEAELCEFGVYVLRGSISEKCPSA
jgi:hypothetical protein